MFENLNYFFCFNSMSFCSVTTIYSNNKKKSLPFVILHGCHCIGYHSQPLSLPWSSFVSREIFPEAHFCSLHCRGEKLKYRSNKSPIDRISIQNFLLTLPLFKSSQPPLLCFLETLRVICWQHLLSHLTWWPRHSVSYVMPLIPLQT